MFAPPGVENQRFQRLNYTIFSAENQEFLQNQPLLFFAGRKELCVRAFQVMNPWSEPKLDDSEKVHASKTWPKNFPALVPFSVQRTGLEKSREA